MTHLSALDTLIELAAKETDAAAKRLAQAIADEVAAEQKRSLLAQYRDEYSGRLQQRMGAGLGAMTCQNFKLFLVKLDDALGGQQQVVREAQKRIEQERSAWQAGERKRMSYNTLAARACEASLRKEVRIEQKQTDEFAARRLLYKR